MNRQEKEALVESLRQSFSECQSSFVVLYRGLSVPKVQQLRRGLREKSGLLKIAKARLMKLAVEGLDGVEGLTPFLKDQIGLVFASGDTPAVAKELCGFAKKNESFSILACSFESQVLDNVAICQLATLPSREVLLGQVAGLLKMPTTQFVQLLNMLIVRLLFVLKKIEEKKAAE
ncbi:50S ribosomal protein L10 [bacterium]|jgi:large subunit ribosomal protein L10|nr:50S ribosomal protein L10 [bacterium]